MSATVEIQTKKVYDVTAVPIQAVTTRDTLVRASSREVKGRPEDGEQAATEEKTDAAPEGSVRECVFVISDGVVTLRPVKTGIQDNTYIEITEGLKPGEEVVTGPYNAISRLLKNDDKVKVVPREQLFEVEK